MCGEDRYVKTPSINLTFDGIQKSVRLGGCKITEGLLAYFGMVTVPHKMVGLERMLDYRGFRLEKLHYSLYVCAYIHNYTEEELSRERGYSV